MSIKEEASDTNILLIDFFPFFFWSTVLKQWKTATEILLLKRQKYCHCDLVWFGMLNNKLDVGDENDGASEVSVISFDHNQLSEAWTGPRKTNTSSKTSRALKEHLGGKIIVKFLHMKTRNFLFFLLKSRLSIGKGEPGSIPCVSVFLNKWLLSLTRCVTYSLQSS